MRTWRSRSSARRCRGWSSAFAQATRSLIGDLIFRKRLRKALRADGPPTLIVHGDQDRLVDVRASREVAARNPRIGLKELPNRGTRRSSKLRLS